MNAIIDALQVDCKSIKIPLYFYNMPHYRHRHIESLFKNLLAYSPIVGLFGHRQVGKTTWISKICKEYTTLDILTESTLLNSNPLNYLMHRKHPFAIDESQLSPALFPALKETVRVNPKPGQFIITGSVRFSSRKQIRESLTGRFISWELIPMDLNEIHSMPLSRRLETLSNSKSFDVELKPSTKFNLKDYSQYLKNGGLPGLFSIRNEIARKQKLELQIETLLERDLRLIVDTKLSYSTLRLLISELANQQLKPFEIYPLSHATQISVPTLMSLMRAFEAMYLIRWIPTIGSTRKKSFIFEDQGEATYLQTNPVSAYHDFIRFLYANLRTQWHYQNKYKVFISQLRNRTGQWVPLVIQGFGTHELGILPMLESTPSPSVMNIATHFQKHFPKGRLLLVHHDLKLDQMIHPQIRSISWTQLI